jgi:hypothetical protein
VKRRDHTSQSGQQTKNDSFHAGRRLPPPRAPVK